MQDRTTDAAISRGFARVALAAVATVILAAPAFAQQPPPPPAPKNQPKAPAPKVQQKSSPPPSGQTQQQPQQQGEPKIEFSNWTKICQKGPDGKNSVCFTVKDGALETGMTVVAAVLIEPEGEPKKILRITLPLGVSLPPGTRVVVDQGQPMNAPFNMCIQTGCMADYEASSELIANLKKGKGLAVMGLNGAQQVFTFMVPLGDFAKANEGASVDPQVFEQQQRKRYEEIQKRYEENQKKLQQKQ